MFHPPVGPQVAACKDVFPEKEKDCGTYSEEVQGKTLNGVPGVISDLTVTCQPNRATSANAVLIHWQPPVNPNGIIDRYKIELKESAFYFNEEGQRQFHNDERQVEVDGARRNYTYSEALPNTNYTIKVTGGLCVRIYV